ncbi:alkyl sulfatase dimerization domain-containing protein, partial [Streptosporangium sp. NPDC048865]|uniref:alkyl sulfatase dimerization domain-containing protein n=1 Tax=Streptosporangium sp. NPDC048865 TaxID=3155766 RepID=UPI00343B7ED1
NCATARSATTRCHRRSGAGDQRLAGHLAEMAARAAPDDAALHRVRAEVFAARAESEASLMARGVFAWAAEESRRAAGDAPA